jgi:hypothetical protein
MWNLLTSGSDLANRRHEPPTHHYQLTLRVTRHACENNWSTASVRYSDQGLSLVFTVSTRCLKAGTSISTVFRPTRVDTGEVLRSCSDFKATSDSTDSSEDGLSFLLGIIAGPPLKKILVTVGCGGFLRRIPRTIVRCRRRREIQRNSV